jgi:hypothetical protein
MRTASVLCGLLALGLLGYAGYRYAVDRDPPSGATLIVHEPDRDLGPQPCGAAVPVSFRLTNASSQPLQVFGLVPS